MQQELEKSVRQRMKNNIRFKRKVEWYGKGQRRCPCCGVQMTWENGGEGDGRTASVEHLVQASLGGSYHAFNIITCTSCNYRRRDTDWIDWIEENNFPKKQWLIDKYIAAVDEYATMRDQNDRQGIGRRINGRVFKSVESFRQKAAA